MASEEEYQQAVMGFFEQSLDMGVLPHDRDTPNLHYPLKLGGLGNARARWLYPGIGIRALLYCVVYKGIPVLTVSRNILTG